MFIVFVNHVFVLRVLTMSKNQTNPIISWCMVLHSSISSLGIILLNIITLKCNKNMVSCEEIQLMVYVVDVTVLNHITT